MDCTEKVSQIKTLMHEIEEEYTKEYSGKWVISIIGKERNPIFNVDKSVWIPFMVEKARLKSAATGSQLFLEYIILEGKGNNGKVRYQTYQLNSPIKSFDTLEEANLYIMLQNK